MFRVFVPTAQPYQMQFGSLACALRSHRHKRASRTSQRAEVRCRHDEAAAKAISSSKSIPAACARCTGTRTRTRCNYPEFSPGLNKAEGILLQQEWKAALDIYSGREAAKMGVAKNGLCLLVGYASRC